MKGSKELRKSLPYGAVSMLAAKYGVSWTWVYNVVSGKTDGNPDIIMDANKLAKISLQANLQIKEIIYE